mmetsp:Transcript_26542/g.47978  ORF Transcript_26542/g.47978 Transcript_26542/m.47978 type:complete len:315 (-) Transcript_26542:73-1017(-)|eukprot:CAMPEP_0197654410 /NCGR_PEP_ID=MMETSP1338-20131121/38836_1 /TAXON_ID=43686 ORGANISM="Pelagodinium beii, Strain RCC1491" /NCGR_SAMPLE_ID=MMETSP1338 /ASSEMBLY_ACC=CAM_ASM_000754 /LENGTH=314 /DNA_ID=CAMNT_0043229853 /DNA_START=76 /DNA_END=1020 /DNA_ORIENTATION=+
MGIELRDLKTHPDPERLNGLLCGVCKDIAEGLIRLPCGHVFCACCIFQDFYYARRTACPICRRLYTQKDVQIDTDWATAADLNVWCIYRCGWHGLLAERSLHWQEECPWTKDIENEMTVHQTGKLGLELSRSPDDAILLVANIKPEWHHIVMPDKLKREVRKFDSVVAVSGIRGSGIALACMLMHRVKQGPGQINITFRQPLRVNMGFINVRSMEVGLKIEDLSVCWVEEVCPGGLLDMKRQAAPWENSPQRGDVLIAIQGEELVAAELRQRLANLPEGHVTLSFIRPQNIHPSASRSNSSSGASDPPSLGVAT